MTDEPFGHRDYYSKIERIWRTMPAGTSLFRHRTERFDPVSGVLYGPVEYEEKSVGDSIPADLPESQWIDDNFRAFVRGEFASSGSVRLEPASWTPNIVSETTAGLQLFQDLLKTFESRYVYGGLVDRIREEHKDDMIGAIHGMLGHPDLGHHKNLSNVPLAEFRKMVTDQLDHRDRLTFLLPSFPFKDQNRFRTYSGASTVDLGEIALLVRLHCLSLAIYQVHPFGADIVILSDGLMYANIFGVDPKLALRYREQLRGFRNILNIQGTVSILDLSEIIQRFEDPSKGESQLSQCIGTIRNRVATYEQRHDELSEIFSVLVRGMKWNLSTRDSLSHLSDHDAWVVINELDANAVPTNLKKDWTNIHDRARVAAVEYAGVNLMLRYFDLLNRVFPGALRCTVHPKKGQFAVPMPGKVYPWNGVGTVNKGDSEYKVIKTVALHELFGQDVDLVRLDMSGEPLYFSVSGNDDRH